MIGQYCLDANIFIAAWRKSYPISSFPSLWTQISQHRQAIILIKPIYDEIEPISPSDKNLSSNKKSASASLIINSPYTAPSQHWGFVEEGQSLALAEGHRRADYRVADPQAWTLDPPPELLILAVFQFDPEAAKDIEELKPEAIGMQSLKVQTNTDIQADDLKKKRASSKNFWLIDQLDVEVEQIPDGEDVDKHRVLVRGLDCSNTQTGGLESGDKTKISVWMLDTDYDGRSLYPTQVFFPMAGGRGGWVKLARNLKVEIDEDKIEAYRGTQSLPFKVDGNGRVAIKIVDDREVESLRMVYIMSAERK